MQESAHFQLVSDSSSMDCFIKIIVAVAGAVAAGCYQNRNYCIMANSTAKMSHLKWLMLS